MSPAAASYFVGVMTGTSIDGLDLALLEMQDDAPRLLDGTTISLDAELGDRLRALAAGDGDELEALAASDHLLGSFIGEAVSAFLCERDIAPGEITAVGSHGQTLRHRPDGARPFSVQIGDPNLIAETTGITTVADFRRRDLAAGGQGAPLVPGFHAALFRREDEPAVVVNIGGIANITVLAADPSRPVTGFDTGPGNALMDAWSRRERGEPFDREGAWAATGRTQPQLLTSLLDDPYFSRPPPKSTGKERFNLAWLEGHLAGMEAVAPVDIQATVTALTARTIADGVERWGCRRGNVIVCGGGRLNRQLMRLLGEALPRHEVTTTEARGVNGDWVEAAAFAWLAWRRLQGLPGNEPAVTGAAGPRILGAVYAA